MVRKVPIVRFKGHLDAWEQRKLGGVSSIKTGNSDLQDADPNGLYPLFVRSEKVERSNKYIYDGEAILIPGEGRLGDIFHYIDGKFDYHQRVYRISDFNREDIHGKYILYEMMKNFKRHALTYTVKATVDSLRLPVLCRYNLLVPIIEEQKLVADLVNMLENNIALLQRKLDLLQELKMTMLNQLFPQTGSKYPNLRFSGFTDDWVQRNYEDVVVLSQGLQIPISERYLESGLDRMLYITNEIFNTRISDRYYIKKPKESVVAKKEDILMTRTGNTGKVVTNIEGAFHNNFFKIDYKEYFDQYFLKYSLTRPSTQREILSRAGSSTIPDISHKDFYSMSVSLPNISEQINIGELIKNIDNTITLHQRKLELLKIQKQYFLKVLFV